MTNTQSEMIDHLRYLSGSNPTSLPEADAVRLLNFGLDSYSYIALTADGLWQFDDTTNPDEPRAVTTLLAGQNRLTLNAAHLTIHFLELTGADGSVTRVEPYDRRYANEVSTSAVGRPARYDLESNVLHFDRVANQTYTVRLFYSRAVPHLVVGAPDQVVGIPTIHVEYPIFHALSRSGFRTKSDAAKSARAELPVLAKEIRDFYRKRDEDTPSIIRGNMDIRA